LNSPDSIKEPVPLKPDSKVDFIKQKLVREEEEFLHVLQRPEAHNSLPFSFDKEVDFLGQITAVDGATIITKDFDLIAFGAKIKSKSKETPEKVLVREPFKESSEIECSLADFGGTRHQSAAQFVFDQNESFAIIASQDGRISVVFWSTKKQMVSAIRHAEYVFFDGLI
jgi:hypothetical protein